MTAKSWKSIVRSADPDHDKDNEIPAYEFGDGQRVFKQKKNPYPDLATNHIRVVRGAKNKPYLMGIVTTDGAPTSGIVCLMGGQVSVTGADGIFSFPTVSNTERSTIYTLTMTDLVVSVLYATEKIRIEDDNRWPYLTCTFELGEA